MNKIDLLHHRYIPVLKLFYLLDLIIQKNKNKIK